MKTISAPNPTKGSFFTVPVNFVLRLVLAALSGLFFAWYGDDHPQSLTFQYRAYYIAAAIGSVVAFIVITYVRFISKRLDSKLPWAATNELSRRRNLWQIILGMAVPGIFIFIASAIYFHLHGIDIMDTFYYRLDHVFLIGPLALLNAYLLIVSLQGAMQRNASQ